MGYFKQIEISNQVELGDRLPAPKPAYTHIANRFYGSRLQRNRARKQAEQARRWANVGTALAILCAVGLGVAAVWGWIT